MSEGERLSGIEDCRNSLPSLVLRAIKLGVERNQNFNKIDNSALHSAYDFLCKQAFFVESVFFMSYIHLEGTMFNRPMIQLTKF